MREQEEKEVSDIPPEIAKKSINDEFEVSDYAFENIKKALEKANKNLRARGMQELQLKVIKTNKKMTHFDPGTKEEVPNARPIISFVIKIEGNIPEIHDYEFIAKVEHTEAGNIINMNPSIPPEKLPKEYRTANQHCDICKTNRERNNTFIIKKVDTGEFTSAGSTCLKKFMPLDAVKAFLELAIQLEAMRNLLINAEASSGEDDDEEGGYGGDRAQRYLDPENFLMYICIAYLSEGRRYVSGKKAQEWSTPEKSVQSTNSLAYDLMHPSYGYTGAEEDERERQAVISKYKSEAESMVKSILEWMKDQDFDQMAVDNPNMENYFQNMKVLSRLSYITPRNTGYYSSFLALYLRANKPKTEPGAEKKQSEYVGAIGDKIELDVTLKSVKGYDGSYGWVSIYNFEDDNGNKFVWFSSSSVDAFFDSETQRDRTDEKFKIKGTVKNQQVSKYNGQKETVLTRVKVLNKLQEQERDEETKERPKLFMAIGISGSGKSSYIKKHFHPDTIITPDEIRREFTGDVSNHTMEPKVWAEVPRRISKSLEDHGIAVLDATNTKSKERMDFLKNYPGVEKIALIFKVDPEVAKARIAKDLEKGTNRSKVPPEVIDKQYKNLMNGYSNLPQQFDKIEYVGESKMTEQGGGEHMANTMFTDPTEPRIKNANINEKEAAGKLHTGDETQQQFVINLAKKNPLGLISISDIATALEATNKDVKDNYARLIRYFNDRENYFVKVIPEVPFRAAAVYQLVDYHDKIPLTKGTKEYDEAEREEQKKFQLIRAGIFYAVQKYQKLYDDYKIVGWVHLDPWEDPLEVEKELPEGYSLSDNYWTKEPTWGKEILRNKPQSQVAEAKIRREIRKIVVEIIREVYKKRKNTRMK